MNHLRIYDPLGRVIRELTNLDRYELDATGALVVLMADRDQPDRLGVVTVAKGEWQVCEEWTGEPPPALEPPTGRDPYASVDQLDGPASAQPGGWQWETGEPIDQGGQTPQDYPHPEPGFQAEPRHAAEPIAGPNPGPRVPAWFPPAQREPVPVADPVVMLPDPIRLSHAMTILCQCDEIRCAAVLNPSLLSERLAVAASVGSGSRPVQPEPLERCTLAALDPHTTGHVHVPGGWPYGAAEHHHNCPRWPGRYNVPGGVVMPQGLPAAVGVAAVFAANGMAGAAAAAAERTPFDVPDVYLDRTDADDAEIMGKVVPLRPGPDVDGHAVGRCQSMSNTELQCRRNVGHGGLHASTLEPGGDLTHW